MKVKYNISFLFLLFVTLITMAISGYQTFKTNVALVEQGKRKAMQDVADLINMHINDQLTQAASKASLIASLPPIQKAFREGNREELIKQLVPTFILQKEKYDVVEGSFWKPPAIAFLRLYDVKKFGEDVSSYLKIIVECMKQQKLQKGVDIGRYGISLRSTAPVLDEEGLIGCFIVGMSFQTVLFNLNDDTDFEAGVFGDEKWLNLISALLPHPDPDQVIGGFRLLEVTNWNKLRPVMSEDLFENPNAIGYKVHTIEGQDYGIVSVPLTNFQGDHIGFVVAAKTFKNFQSLLGITVINGLTSMLLQSIFIIGLIIILYNVLLKHPIIQMGESLNQLGEGKSDVDFDYVSFRDDEVGELGHSAARLKKQLNEHKQQSDQGENDKNKI